MITGGYFCGKLKYQTYAGENTAVNCHCGMCLKISAAPYLTWIVDTKLNWANDLSHIKEWKE